MTGTPDANRQEALENLFDRPNVNIRVVSMYIFMFCTYANVSGYRTLPRLSAVTSLSDMYPMTFPKFQKSEFPKHLDPTGFRQGCGMCWDVYQASLQVLRIL